MTCWKNKIIQKEQDLTVVKQVMSLKFKTLNDLVKLWNSMFDKPPVFRSRQYLIPKLAYRIQELAYGGVDIKTEKAIASAAKELDKNKRKNNKYAPSIGTKIVKEYRGQIHEVLAVENGFAYGGTVFKSLSAIATKITGTKWNGLKFFNVGRDV